MTTVTQPPRSNADDSAFEAIYVEHFEFLVAIAVRKFHVPESEAETLAHEVFLSYLKRSEEVRDVHNWLVGGICHASRYFWRQAGRGGEPVEIDPTFERIDPASSDIHDALPDRLAARAALRTLPPRYQEVLRLRFYDGCSINEIADRLGVKPKYAQKLVTKSLRRAEKNYFAKGKP
jgi:RNA polymerase sigma factor (sigma-70 family)